MINFRLGTLLSVLVVLFLLGGCAQPTATVVYRPGYFVEKPDAIVIRPFAVTAEEAQKDADLLPMWIRTVRAEPQTPQDIEAGRAAAVVVANRVVETLKARGTPAVLATQGQTITPKTAIIVGQFVNQSSATGDLRPSIGFRTEQVIDVRAQLVQSRNIIGEVKAQGSEKDLNVATTSIARQIADVIEQAYVRNGWLPAPIKK